MAQKHSNQTESTSQGLHHPKGWDGSFSSVQAVTTDDTPAAVFSENIAFVLSGGTQAEFYEAIVRASKGTATKKTYTCKLRAHVQWDTGSSGTIISSTKITETQEPLPAAMANAFDAEFQINADALEIIAHAGTGDGAVTWKTGALKAVVQV